MDEDQKPTASADVGPSRTGNIGDELVTIVGGVQLEIAHRDGSKENVTVRQIPLEIYQQFANALLASNEARAIELYCDKPEGWTSTLDLASANGIADKGQEINLPFFRAWLRRQAKWREVQKPGAIAELEKTLAEAIAKLSLSAISAPQSPTTTN